MTSPNISRITRCPVLFDEDGVLAIDKTEGVLSHPNPGKVKGPQPATAFEGSYDFESRSFTTPGGRIWLIHRLDQDTSGVLLAARSQAMGSKLRKLFEEERLKKIYLALVCGRVAPAKGYWNDVLESRKEGPVVRSRILTHGKPNARLRYRVKGSSSKYAVSLLEIELVSGKTHQVRVQAAWRQHPVAGDDIYGHFMRNRELRKSLNLRRLFLHASLLEFRHPSTNKFLHIESPLPEKLQAILRTLRAG